MRDAEGSPVLVGPPVGSSPGSDVDGGGVVAVVVGVVGVLAVVVGTVAVVGGLPVVGAVVRGLVVLVVGASPVDVSRPEPPAFLVDVGLVGVTDGVHGSKVGTAVDLVVASGSGSGMPDGLVLTVLPTGPALPSWSPNADGMTHSAAPIAAAATAAKTA